MKTTPQATQIVQDFVGACAIIVLLYAGLLLPGL